MDIDVFISYHTSSSLNIVKAIVNRLESEGIRCWYAPRDVKGLYSDAIVEAIDACRVFLLILNKPASESHDVVSEINLGIQRLRDHENMVFIPFHVGDESRDLSRSLRYYVGALHWIDALTPPIYARIDELAVKIGAYLGKPVTPGKGIPGSAVSGAGPSGADSPGSGAGSPAGFGDAAGKGSAHAGSPGSAPAPDYHLVSKLPEPRDIFIGREAELEALRKSFDSGKRTVFIEGIGGIGKSEIAKQYAVRNRDRYDAVLFLRYKTDLESLIIDPDEVMITGFPEKTAEETETEYYRKKLAVIRRIADERTLFIIDNFDVDSDPDLAGFTEGRAHVIFTTRVAHPGYACVRVEAMRDDEAMVRLFEQHFGDSVPEEDKEALLTIFRLVDYHTYAIELIAKQMNAGWLSAPEMLEMLSSGQYRDGGMETIEGRAGEGSAFDHLKAVFSVSGLGEEEKQILRELSLLGIEGVNGRIFKEWAGLAGMDPVQKLIKRSWVRRDAAQRVSVHPLVRDVVWAEFPPDFDNCREFLERMAMRLYHAWFSPYKENRELIGCTLAVLEYFMDKPGKTARLFYPLPNFLWQVGLFEDAWNYGRRIYEDIRAEQGQNSYDAANIAFAVASSYFNGLRERESVEWYRIAAEEMEKSIGEPTGDMANAWNKYARCFTWDFMQDFDRAEEYMAKALSMWDTVLGHLKAGEPVPDNCMGPLDEKRAGMTRALVFMELGRLAQMKGDYALGLERAGTYGKELLKYDSEKSNNYTYYFIDCGVCKYHLALEAEDPEEKDKLLEAALGYMRTALDRNLESRGEVAADTVDCQEYVGDILTAQGNFAEALDAYLAADRMASALLGEDSPRAVEIRRKMDRA